MGAEELGWLWEGGGWVSVSVNSVVGTGGVASGRKGVCFLCWFGRILMRLMSIIVPMQWDA